MPRSSGGFLGFGGKLASRIGSTKFVFTFTIHNLQPWMHVQRAIAVGWQSKQGGRLLGHVGRGMHARSDAMLGLNPLPAFTVSF